MPARTSVSTGDYIVLLLSLVIAGVALSSITRLPSWHVEIDVLGSPLGLGLSGRWLLAGLLAAVTAAGMDALVRTMPPLRTVDLRFSATFWILPSLVTLAMATAVPSQLADPRRWLGNLLLLSVLLVTVVVAELGTVDLGGRMYRSSRLVLNVATYGAAFALYATLYGFHVRSLLSATAVMLITFPLALELLRSTADALSTSWLYAAIIALITAELTWPLNRWGLSALVGGALLLLVFYILTGIAQQHLAGRLNRWVLVEFATIGLIGLLLLAVSWLRLTP
jgi:hypothetical protein